MSPVFSVATDKGYNTFFLLSCAYYDDDLFLLSFSSCYFTAVASLAHFKAPAFHSLILIGSAFLRRHASCFFCCWFSNSETLRVGGNMTKPTPFHLSLSLVRLRTFNAGRQAYLVRQRRKHITCVYQMCQLHASCRFTLCLNANQSA